MKSIVLLASLLAVLLLGAGTGWAGEPRACIADTDVECWSGQTYRMAPIPLSAFKLSPSQELEYCNMKMREAMKAMEYFVGSIYFGQPGDKMQLHIFNSIPTQQKWDETIKLWVAAKACWRQP